ncbi:MAG: MBL fold metallo-hydrolase [Oscillospiraceae bacterium]|nr:MBL fold metallo-hydrolase [Oscillospiraceae bacterium]
MKIVIFASGSGGNCMLLSDGDTHLLIDAGISLRRIESALAHAGLTVYDIAGVLITHEHADHISGLGMLLKRRPLPLYAPHTVAARLCGKLPAAEECMRVIPVGERFAVGGVQVRAFHTPHDTDESVGYRVEGTGCFALATDMGHVTDEVADGLRGADTVLIESNHDLSMLVDGGYPIYLKRRILSARGHLSNADCANLAAQLVRAGTKTVILGHLSRENNRPELALAETARLLEGTGAELCCAPVSGFFEREVKRTSCCI